MNIIIEYLLDPAEAFAYNIQFPEVTVLARIAQTSDSTWAICHAIRTKNMENALVIRECHADEVNWNLAFRTAVDIGSVKIARQIFPLCSERNFGGDACFVADSGFHVLMAQLITWGAPAGSALRGARAGWIARIAQSSRESPTEEGIRRAFFDAARDGRIPLMRVLWGFMIPKRKWDSAIKRKVNEVIEAAFDQACTWGRIKTVRYLLALGGNIGSETVDSAFITAASAGHTAMCRFLLSKDAGHPRPKGLAFREAIENAVMNGRAHTVKFLWELPSPDRGWPAYFAGDCLDIAAEYDFTTIARFIRGKALAAGKPINYDRMLRSATREGHTRMMHLAKAFGATNFEGALETIEGSDSDADKSRSLLERWIMEAARQL